MPPAFDIIEHPADVGFIAYGESLEKLFENAALAMFSLACAPENVAERKRRSITVEAAGVESLLYAWLAEILALADTEQLVFGRAEVTSITTRDAGAPAQDRVAGIVFGEKFDRSRHSAGTYIKAVTYHQLKVERADGWRARVFLDV